MEKGRRQEVGKCAGWAWCVRLGRARLELGTSAISPEAAAGVLAVADDALPPASYPPTATRKSCSVVK